jgi:hypothetical protein
MPDPLRVAEAEHGIVRVFAIDAGPEEAPRWRVPDAEDATGAEADWALPAALGVGRLEPRDVQVFEARDLGGMGLSDFLAEGYDLGADQLAPARAELDAADGIVAVIRSGAFDAPATLSPAGGVRPLGAFAEPSVAPSLGGMGEYDSARPGSGVAAEDTPEPEDDAPEIVARFRPDRDTYIRSHLWLAAAGMVGAVAVLYLLDNTTPWIGAVAALLAVAVRGAYLASEELAQSWELTETGVRHVSAEGRPVRSVPLRDVAQVRKLGSAVQIVTRAGDKMLLKYMAAPEDVRARLARAAGVPAS